MGMSFINVDRETPMLLPVDLRDWVRQDDQVHFIIEAVNLMDLRAFSTGHPHGAGKAQYPPHMMLALLIYCYSLGIFGSRRIERATYRDIGVRYLCGDTHPDHDTICEFRRKNLPAIAECFLRVLELAQALKLLKLGNVAIDGTHLRANASKDKNLTLARAQELEAKLRQDVQGLLAQAEAADAAGEGRDVALPKEIARREALVAKMQSAQTQLQARAEASVAGQWAEFEEKVEAYRERGGRGTAPNTPPTPEEQLQKEPKTQTNLSDADSRVMRKSQSQSTTQSYNPQAVVDADGSQLIVAARVSQCSADTGELVADVQAIPKSLGKPAAVLSDSGFCSVDNLRKLSEMGIEAYVAVAREDQTTTSRAYDYRPREAATAPARAVKHPDLVAMRDKLRQPEAKALYLKRQQSVEPAFGIIKSAMGFRQFTLRGLEKVSGEWTLVALAYNCKRIAKLLTAPAKTPPHAPKSAQPAAPAVKTTHPRPLPADAPDLNSKTSRHRHTSRQSRLLRPSRVPLRAKLNPTGS
jgi:transposase